MSKRASSKTKQGRRPIILPQAFAAPQGEQGTPLLSGQQTRQIQELIDLLKKNNLTEMELEQKGLRIRVRHETGVRTITAAVAEQATSISTSAVQTPAAAGTKTGDTSGMITIASPIVGTFYRSPSPDADPYVDEGDYVKKGQVLCIVEAMKLMNEIDSEYDGEVVSAYVENGQPVQYGERLFAIRTK